MDLERVTKALAEANLQAMGDRKVGAILLDPPVLEGLPQPQAAPRRRAYGCKVSGCYRTPLPYGGDGETLLLLLVHPRGTLIAPAPHSKPLPSTPVLMVLGVLAPQARLLAPMVAAIGRAASRGKLQIWTLEAADKLPSSENLGTT